MKKLIYFLTFLLILSACKKNTGNVNTLRDDIPAYAPIDIEIVDNTGKSVIHSPNDTLMVTFLKNGVSQSYRLNIFKVEKADDDTTLITNYNGYVLTDNDFSDRSGAGSFLVSPSLSSVRNFSFSLNGKFLGAVYYDCVTSQQNLVNNVTNTAFTLNNIPATFGVITGYIAAGYPSLASVATLSGTIRNFNLFTPTTGMPIFILRYD